MSKIMASVIGLILTAVGAVFIALPKTVLLDKENDENDVED